MKAGGASAPIPSFATPCTLTNFISFSLKSPGADDSFGVTEGDGDSRAGQRCNDVDWPATAFGGPRLAAPPPHGGGELLIFAPPFLDNNIASRKGGYRCAFPQKNFAAPTPEWAEHHDNTVRQNGALAALDRRNHRAVEGICINAARKKRM